MIKSYKNAEDDNPNIIDIDSASGNVKQISTTHDQNSLRSIHRNIGGNLKQTFLPNGYPHSVRENYMRFAVFSNIGAVSFTAMSFIST